MRVKWVAKFVAGILVSCHASQQLYAQELEVRRANRASFSQSNQEYVYELTNSGTDTLVVEGLRFSCNCASAHLQATRISPGSNAVLTVRLSVGAVKKGDPISVYLISNSRRNHIHHIQVVPGGIDGLVISGSPVYLDVGGDRNIYVSVVGVHIDRVAASNISDVNLLSLSPLLKTAMLSCETNGLRISYTFTVGVETNFLPDCAVETVAMMCGSQDGLSFKQKIPVVIRCRGESPMKSKPCVSCESKTQGWDFAPKKIVLRRGDADGVSFCGRIRVVCSGGRALRKMKLSPVQPCLRVVGGERASLSAGEKMDVDVLWESSREKLDGGAGLVHITGFVGDDEISKFIPVSVVAP